MPNLDLLKPRSMLLRRLSPSVSSKLVAYDRCLTYFQVAQPNIPLTHSNLWL
jgi:hypothetical protein